jgi:hypothetical protein
MNALRLILVVLGAMQLASLGACSSAGMCRRGELGCICQSGNICESGAQCVAERCTKSAAAAGSGGAGSGGGGGRDASKAGGNASDLCSSESFDAACHSYCIAFCDNQRLFCDHSACEPGDCDAANYTAHVRPVCQENCGDDAECAWQLCLGQRSTTCEKFRGFKADGEVVPGCIHNDPTCELSSD